MNLTVYGVSGFGVIILGRLIHYFAIIRYLKRRGIKREFSLFHNRDLADLAAYKKIRLSEGEPLIWWYVLSTIVVLIGFWVMGWIALVLSQSK